MTFEDHVRLEYKHSFTDSDVKVCPLDGTLKHIDILVYPLKLNKIFSEYENYTTFLAIYFLSLIYNQLLFQDVNVICRKLMQWLGEGSVNSCFFYFSSTVNLNSIFQQTFYDVRRTV